MIKINVSAYCGASNSTEKVEEARKTVLPKIDANYNWYRGVTMDAQKQAREAMEKRLVALASSNQTEDVLLSCRESDLEADGDDDDVSVVSENAVLDVDEEEHDLVGFG